MNSPLLLYTCSPIRHSQWCRHSMLCNRASLNILTMLSSQITSAIDTASLHMFSQYFSITDSSKLHLSLAGATWLKVKWPALVAVWDSGSDCIAWLVPLYTIQRQVNDSHSMRVYCSSFCVGEMERCPQCGTFKTFQTAGLQVGLWKKERQWSAFSCSVAFYVFLK
jgi:hypothetical protein